MQDLCLTSYKANFENTKERFKNTKDSYDFIYGGSFIETKASSRNVEQAINFNFGNYNM